MDPDKVSAVADWPVPSSVWALRGFLGLTGHAKMPSSIVLTGLFKAILFTGALGQNHV